MSESSNFSSNQSSSTSSPTFLETPENSILDQLSQYASGLAQQMNDWANQTYAKTSQITDQAVGNFFNVSQRMSDFGQRMTDQYNNTFAPENAQLVKDANSYASPERMAVDMGQAGATQQQAGDKAIKNSEQNLLSFGIDPSAGRYAALDKAAAVQNAANAAGAMNTQRNADIATGQRLRSEAVQAGSLLPSAIANANNTAIQANTGASNASLANANTGANLKALADKYLQTAMSLKLPPTGQNSNSQGTGQSMGQSSSPGRSSSSGSGGGAGAGGAGGSGSGPAWMPQHGDAQGGGVGAIGGARMQPGAKSSSTKDNSNSDQDWSTPPPPVIDPTQFYSPGMGIGQPTTDAVPYTGGNGNVQNPFDNGQFGQTYGDNQGGTFGNLNQMNGDFIGASGNLTYDPSANQAQLPGGWQDPTFDPGPDSIWGDGANQIGQAPADQMYNSPWGGGGGDVQSSPDWSTGSYGNGMYASGDVQGDANFFNQGGGQDYGQYTDTGGNDYSQPSYDNSQSYNDTSYSDTPSSGGYDGYYAGQDNGGYDSGSYARGGQIRGPQRQNFRPGGNVTPNMSPSRGQRTDDVSANVNVGEFVVPKDVVQYKGHQFFENLIKQSRKNRAMQGMVQNHSQRMR